MTAVATSASSASAPWAAARTTRAAHRRSAFDFGRGHADDDEVAFLQRSGNYVRVAAVADAGADLDRLQLLLRVERVDGLRLRRIAAPSAGQLSRRAGG